MSQRYYYLCPYCKEKKMILPPQKKSGLPELAGFEFSEVVLSESRMVVEIISCLQCGTVISINRH